MNFVGLVLDLTATVVYMIDYFRIRADFNHVLILMGVKDYGRAFELIKNYQKRVQFPATQATLYVYCISSKMFLPLLLFFVFGIVSIKSMWEVVSENRRAQNIPKRTTDEN